MTSQNKGANLPDFIIFGAGNYNSLGVLHCMASAGVRVFLLMVGDSRDCSSGNIILYSSFADKRWLHTASSEQEAVDWLIANAGRFPKGTVIYPTGDSAEKELDEHFSQLSPYFIFPGCGEEGATAKLMDKKLQTSIAAECGLPIIESQYTESDAFDIAKVTYPCFVKPLDSTRGSKGDMRVCETQEQLLEAITNRKTTKSYIVQQYIRNEADLLFLGVAYPDGSVHLPALVRKPGVSPTGEYSFAEVITDVDRYLPEKLKVETFVRCLGYQGPFSIEFGHEKGQNYFFEINLRNDGTVQYPLNARVNIPFAYYRAVTGAGFEDFSAVTQTSYNMIDETRDLRRVLSREISPLQWFRLMRKAGSYRYYSKGDKSLIIPLVRMAVTVILSKLVRMIGSRRK